MRVFVPGATDDSAKVLFGLAARERRAGAAPAAERARRSKTSSRAPWESV